MKTRFSLYEDIDKLPVVIDCSTYQKALYSMALLLDREPKQLIKDIVKVGDRLTLFDDFPRPFVEMLAEDIISNKYLRVHVKEIHWFHFTRVPESTQFRGGLKPLKMILPAVWDSLISIFEEINPMISMNLLEMRGGQINREYAWKVNSEFDQGPCAMLIRDMAFYSKDLGNVDYLGCPEIVQDIFNAYKEKHREDISTMYNEATSACIVTFNAPCNYDEIESIVTHILSYLYYYPNDTIGHAYCYNGEGRVIEPSNILKVEFRPEKSIIPNELELQR